MAGHGIHTAKGLATPQEDILYADAELSRPSLAAGPRNPQGLWAVTRAASWSSLAPLRLLIHPPSPHLAGPHHGVGQVGAGRRQWPSWALVARRAPALTLASRQTACRQRGLVDALAKPAISSRARGLVATVRNHPPPAAFELTLQAPAVSSLQRTARLVPCSALDGRGGADTA